MDYDDHDANPDDLVSSAPPDSTSPPLPISNWRPPPSSSPSSVRYRECLKNHAVNIGGHAVDGCGEFMPAGADGSLDALKCAACGCHRNFHRKELAGHSLLPFYRVPPSNFLSMAAPPRPAALPSTSGRLDEPPSAALAKKRFRTRFSQEQKEKMLAFAERLGWRIQKSDDLAVQQFCAEVGVKRHVFKVWMHNNKHTLGSKPPLSEP
ncbi:zinc-finger homeodomain protein 2-like [Wolffia australiana]